MPDDDHLAMLDVRDEHKGPVLLSGYRSPLYDDRIAQWTRIDAEGRAYRGADRAERLCFNPAAANTQRRRMI